MYGTRGDLAHLRLVAGLPCLDFANTVDPRWGGSAALDYLQSYENLLEWSRRTGLTDEERSRRLRLRLAAAPHTAEVVFHRAISLREAVYAVFGAVADGLAPASGDLGILERTLHETAHAVRLSWNGVAADWLPVPDDPTLELPLFQLTQSAIDLLASLPTQVVKRCPGAGDCGWLFLDKSKNHSRRWCTADGCGARVKMRRRYRRIRAAPQPPSAHRPRSGPRRWPPPRPSIGQTTESPCHWPATAGTTPVTPVEAEIAARDESNLRGRYRFRPDFCEAGDPESKGAVEALVGYAKSDLVVPADDFCVVPHNAAAARRLRLSRDEGLETTLLTFS